MLTALLPTRNRALYCARQLSFLRKNEFRHRIVVLDASDEDQAEAVHAACADFAEYRHFEPSFRMADKLAAAVRDVTTPFVLLVPDDDVILLHAIAAELDFLQENPDFVVAHGYFLSFAVHGDDIDIHNVIGFTPSITDDSPLRRHYELFRRYQSFYWGVFRTEIFASAVTAACAMNVVLLRELTVMSTSIIQGKVARLPLVHAVRGTAKSHAPLHQSHPLFWVLRNAESFFKDYLVYRNAIATFIHSKGIEAPKGTRLEQLLDLTHATWLAREIDVGMINHSARLSLGDSIPPIRPNRMWDGWREPCDNDVIHLSAASNRRYVWRKRVIDAEPRGEITIGSDEMARVEQELDAYGT